MNNEKIIEIAERYGRIENMYHGLVWLISEDALLDFAKAVIKERFAEDAESKHGYISNDALNRMGGRLYREHSYES